MTIKHAFFGLFSAILSLVACGGDDFSESPKGDSGAAGLAGSAGGAGLAGESGTAGSAGGAGVAGKAGSAGGSGKSGAGQSGSGGSKAGTGGSSGDGGSAAGQSGAGASSGAASGGGAGTGGDAGGSGEGGASGDGGFAGAPAGSGGSAAGGVQGGNAGAGQSGSGGKAGSGGSAGSPAGSGGSPAGAAGASGAGNGGEAGGAACAAVLDAACDPGTAEECDGLVCGCNGQYIKTEQEPWLICTTKCGPYLAKEGEITVCYRLPADEHGPETFPEYPLWGLTGGISTGSVPLTEAYQNPLPGCVQTDPKLDHVLCRFKGSYEKGSGIVAHFAPHRFKNPGESGPFICGPDCCPGDAQIHFGNVSGGSYSSCLTNSPGVSEEKDPLNANSEMIAFDLGTLP